MKTRILFLLLAIVTLLPIIVSAQKRDNLTDKEDLQVREIQEFDLRMKVYVKIIDRRLLAISDSNAPQNKQVQKDIDSWGELRIGSGRDLFWDIQKTLDEAIGKIDDVAERDLNNPLFGKAVHILSDGCKKWTPQFKLGLDKTTDEKEKGLIINSIESCTQVIEATSKIPKEEKKKKN